MADADLGQARLTAALPEIGVELMSQNFRNRALASVAAVAIVASGTVGAALYEGQPAFAQTAKAPITVNAQAPATFADVVDQVKPAVVSVRVKVENAIADGDGLPSSQLENVPPQLREFFRRFGENGMPGDDRRGPRQRREVRQGVGSGFLISADGYVVTNNHVVDGAKTVQAKTDVALLKVTEGGNFPFVKLAKASPRVGDWVVAIGNPFGLGGTVTSGIVSARGRDIGAGPYDDFLQIDAPINKGNSGGPTFNLQGEVVGMNTAIYSPSGGSVGLAFAVPASTVQTVVDQLQQDGRVSRGYLGVQIQPLTKELAQGFGLSTEKGALVASTQDGTPAEKAGLKSGDVITAVDGEPVANARELTRKIGALKPGAKAEIAYLRDGKERTATIALASQPGEKEAKAAPSRSDDGLPRLGLELAPSREGEGVAVAAVDPDGPAAQKGVKEGDVILEVGGHAVSKPADVKAGLEAAHKAGKMAVLLRVKSKNGTRFVAIAMPKAG